MNLHDRAVRNYDLWINDPNINEEIKLELKQIEHETGEITDRFYKDLEFGTGGLRGLIGAGSNRLNVYTIGKATQGLAQYILQRQSVQQPSCVIAYDSRHRSPEFALEAALVLAGNGVKAYVFDALRPTPELSFAVRHLQATAGIVITASHNPPEYNGYKVYGNDGGQLTPEAAEQVIAEIQRVESFSAVKKLTREDAQAKGLLCWIGEEMDEAYVQAVTSVCQHPEMIRDLGSRFRIVFTPLHGAGNVPVRSVLKRIGFDHVFVVKDQEQPDPDFSTVDSPNPEEASAFQLAIEQAKANDADIIIGTDPDADRMGAVVKDASGSYRILTGNQSGALIVNYILSSMKSNGALPANGAVVKTIVTSELGAMIAERYGMKVFNTLTGFKYIGQKMEQFDRSGEHTFVFGYEESYGYLAGNYARDKDAVVASMLICEAAAFYKHQGKTLHDVLEELYQTYGYFIESLETRTLKGIEGLAKIRKIMEDWRTNRPSAIQEKRVVKIEDYSEGLYGLPQEDVLKYFLEDGSWFCLRPSGTEPKIKIYFAVRGSSHEDASHKMSCAVNEVMSRIDRYI